MVTTKVSGDIGEEYAVNYLLELGYEIIDKNFRSKLGEIDIIAKEGGDMVFIEVKTRWSKRFGLPEEAVTPTKLGKIKKTIEYYSLINKIDTKYIRIEVVAILVLEGKIESVKLIKLD